jgi:hypothetical protein
VERLDALGYLDHAPAPSAIDADGVVVRDSARSWPGYNLATFPFLRRAELFEADGKTVRSWRQAEGASRWERAVLLPGAELLVVVRLPDGLIRLDAEGNVLWEATLPIHHHAVRLGDGRLAVLTTRYRRQSDLEVGPFWDNGVAILSPEGEILMERSLTEMLSRSPGVFAVSTEDIPVREGRPLDLLHADYLHWITDPGLAKRDPRFRPGTVLVTIRNQDSVVLFDWERGEALWAWGRGELRRPHDASVLPDGNVLVFDNRTDTGWSRVVEVDPRTERIVWSYRAPNPSDFYTQTRGTVQRLPNGNTLIGESNQGRGFEVTREGEIVWEYLVPRNEKGRRPAFRLERYPLTALDPLPAAAGVRGR